MYIYCILVSFLDSKIYFHKFMACKCTIRLFSICLLFIISLSSLSVKKAYRTLSLKFHPDRCPSDEKENATTRFQLVSKIYSVLSDTDKRALYDETGRSPREFIAKILKFQTDRK